MTPEERLASAVDVVPTFIASFDADLKFVACNRRFEELFSRPREEIVGCPVREIVGETNFERLRPFLEAALSGERAEYAQWLDYPRHGRRFMRAVYVPYLDGEGKVAGFDAHVVDDTEGRLAQEALAEAKTKLEVANKRLAELATTDDLTGLKNPRVFRERLAEEVAEAKRLSRDLSVVLLDVDRFKAYNDAYGHPAGDEALRTVAEALRGETRGYDVAARYGGEELALLLPSTGQREAACVAERVRRSVQERPWPLRPVTASLGVASLSGQASTPETLVEAADRALYVAKETGRNRVALANV